MLLHACIRYLCSISRTLSFPEIFSCDFFVHQSRFHIQKKFFPQRPVRLELTKILCNGGILLYEVRLPKLFRFLSANILDKLIAYLRNLTIKSERKCRSQLRSLLGWYAGGGGQLLDNEDLR